MRRISDLLSLECDPVEYVGISNTWQWQMVREPRHSPSRLLQIQNQNPSPIDFQLQHGLSWGERYSGQLPNTTNLTHKLEFYSFEKQSNQIVKFFRFRFPSVVILVGRSSDLPTNIPAEVPTGKPSVWPSGKPSKSPSKQPIHRSSLLSKILFVVMSPSSNRLTLYNSTST